jgi:hypothetical protein
MVARNALDRLRSNARRRDKYVGEWLPEPLLTARDLTEDVQLAENVSFAIATVLETLPRTEIGILPRVVEVRLLRNCVAAGVTLLLRWSSE